MYEREIVVYFIHSKK